MDAHWERLDALFGEALNLTSQEQARLLERTATEDPELARKLEELMRADADASRFLDPPTREAVRGALEKVQELAVGAPIGPYRVVRTLGIGGMGSVYLARRDDGDRTRDQVPEPGDRHHLRHRIEPGCHDLRLRDGGHRGRDG